MDKSSLLLSEEYLLKGKRKIKHSRNGYLVVANEKITDAIWDIEHVLNKN